MISKFGLQTWYDIPALGDPTFMMMDLMNDALINLVRMKAARDPISRLQGLNYPWNADVTDEQHKGAMPQVGDIDPHHFWVTFKEIIKYHMYNTSNVTAYLTIIKKYPRKSSKEKGYGCWQQRLGFFPTDDAYTPLRLSDANNAHIITANNTLNWGYPDYQVISNLADPANIAGSINPFMPTAGADQGVLTIPRQYGAFILMFPTNPWPSFLQQNSSNFFNQGPSHPLASPNVVFANETTGGYFNENSSTHYAAASVGAIDEVASKFSGSGTDPSYFRPYVASNYFTNNSAPASTSTTAGSSGASGQAYITVNYTQDPSISGGAQSIADYDTFVTTAAPQWFNSNLGALGGDGANARVGWRPQDKPFGPELGGTGYNWSTHPQYDELKNKCMRRIFKMYAKRVTLQPGKVLRWTLKGRRATINPERDHLINNLQLTHAPSVWTGAPNANNTLSGWGSENPPIDSIAGNGGQLQCPSMWGPEWPCRTVVWSCSIRGQTAQKQGASDLANIVPTQLLLKKDHCIHYAVKYKPVTKDLRTHATNRNFLAWESSATPSGYQIQYPILGAIAGGTAAATSSTAVPSGV